MPYDMDGHMIEYCAPTLAGHKCGCLFTCSMDDSACEETRAHYAAMLGRKGVSVELIPARGGRCMVYVYRPAALQRRLDRADVRAFLSGYGYDRFDLDSAIARLRSRLAECGGFPHEIGIFLDYPLCDVIEFIKRRGEGYACLGWWKCYTDTDNAIRRFALYNKCREVYARCYKRGFDLSRLVVAG